MPTGQRNPNLNQDPPITIGWFLNNILKFIRTDYGGKDSTRIISQRLSEKNIPVTSETIKAYKLGATRTRDTIKAYLEPRVIYLKKLFK